MSNIQSYNALIDRFKAFASGHFILKAFSHGQINEADLAKFSLYPFMHVVPADVTYDRGTKTFSFQIILADLPRDKEDKTEYQKEVLSDLQRIAEDLIAEITNHRMLFGDLITCQNVSIQPFLEEFHHTLTGWTVSIDLLVPYYWDACSIPAEWNDMFESSTGGTGTILSFEDSIVRDENGIVTLVNDEANPAPNYYYGTNSEGVRGWYLITDEVGLTCQTIGSCQTIIDIESEIDLLQTDVTQLQTDVALKANIADISAVGFSNDYNDLDNLPNLSGYGDMFKAVYDTDADGVVDSAERIEIVVRNSTGVTLTKGQIVYLSGATGNRPNAVLAQANAELTSSKTIGMITADIANNADGLVAVNGTLHDIDTSAFTAGDTLWLSATTAGGMVANTPPSEPNHTVFIGYVARSHPNQGRIVLAIQNGYELDELHGVQITTPANNEVLTYESSTSLWKNKTVATALGYTPVPTTRSLTINGTAYDLSADRSWTIATGLTVGTTPITSGTIGRVLFEGAGNVLQESSNFFWDNTNNRLGIGTATPAFSLQIVGGDICIDNNKSYIAKNSGGSTLSLLKFDTSNNCLIGSNFQGGATNIYATTNILFYSYPSSVLTERMRIVGSTGNVLIGTTTDAGYKLDVNGTARVQNTLNVNAVGDSISVNSGAFVLQSTSGIVNYRGTSPNSSGSSHNFTLVSSFTNTSGDYNLTRLIHTFNPTSGTATNSSLLIVPTINQTGGASGITRGLYINPTLTAAADFRAIEVASGITVLGASTTAKASLRIPSGTAPTSPVNGDIWFDGTNIKMQIGGVTKTFTLI